MRSEYLEIISTMLISLQTNFRINATPSLKFQVAVAMIDMRNRFRDASLNFFKGDLYHLTFDGWDLQLRGLFFDSKSIPWCTEERVENYELLQLRTFAKIEFVKEYVAYDHLSINIDLWIRICIQGIEWLGTIWSTDFFEWARNLIKP